MKEIKVRNLGENPNIFVSEKIDLMMRGRYGSNYLPEKTTLAVNVLTDEIMLRKNNGQEEKTKKWWFLTESEYKKKTRQLISNGIMCSSTSVEVDRRYDVYVFAIGWQIPHEDQEEILLERSCGIIAKS